MNIVVILRSSTYCSKTPKANYLSEIVSDVGIWSDSIDLWALEVDGVIEPRL